MTKIKEIHAKAGPLLGYLGYFLIVFLWYFSENMYSSLGEAIPASSIKTLLEWGCRIAIVPLILSGVFGGIHERQQQPDTSGTSGFVTGVKKFYGRILAAYLLYFVVYLIAVLALALTVFKSTSSEESRTLIAFIISPLFAITLFWYATIVVEHQWFRGLLHAVKILLLNPYALIIGIVWATLSAADNAFFDIPGISPGNPTLLVALNGLRAIVLAAVRIIAIAYALAVYKTARGDVPAETLLIESPAESPGDGWVTASFGFAFAAFIPLVHLLALAFGIIALRRKNRFVFRSAIACGLGVFFTIFYLLVIAGWIVNRASPPNAPGYAFLAEANADLKQQVALLETGSTREIRQLAQALPNSPERHWTVDSVSALVKYRNHDLDEALDDFRRAAEKKPDQGEFYYYYGVVLLEDNKTEMAAEQFQAALAHEPKLAAAEQYLELINTAYEPSTLVSALLSILILLILFTLHEYGHAYAAWKLGDDTAKNLGRLTLNPAVHLDLFGSIILPAILLMQQAGVVFGWAKPVPVNPQNFQEPKKDHMRVAFAGPAVNFIISMVCLVGLGLLLLLVRLVWPETLALNLADPFPPISIVGPPFARWLLLLVLFLKQMFYTSLVLGCFNLLPIPPLDGSWILSGLLPEKFSVLFEKIRPFGFLIFLLLVVTPIFDSVMVVPVTVAWAGLQVIVSAIGLG